MNIVKKNKILIIWGIMSLILFFGYPLLLMSGYLTFNVDIYKLLLHYIYPLYFFISSIFYTLKSRKIKFNLFIVMIVIFSLNILIFYNLSAYIYIIINVCAYMLGLLIANLIITNRQ